ncbi:MAG: TSUP family transporter, partial [Actinomycetota bacterium]
VPALTLVLAVPLTAAVGTSLVVIAVTSAGALAAHLSSGRIDWGVAAAFTAAAVVGALVGSRVGRRARPYRLAQAFAVVVVGVAAFLVAENVAAFV